MSERSLLDYQREVSEISKPKPAPENPTEDEPKWGLMAATLYRAGWSHVVRGPRNLRIWCEDHDDWRCGWRSEKVAYSQVTEGEG